MSPPVSKEEWFNSIESTVNNSDSISLSVIERTDRPYILVKFNDVINTVSLLENVTENIKNQTKMQYTSDNTIKLKYLSSKTIRDTIYHKDIISKILSEDIPVRNKFEVDYTIYPNYISVKVPQKEPIQIFSNIRTNLWQLTGLYKKDGIYVQQYSQLNSLSEIPPNLEQESEKLKNYRITNILRNTQFNCPNCNAKKVSHDIDVDQLDSRNHIWKCSNCTEQWPSNHEPKEIGKRISATQPREQIISKLREIATKETQNEKLDYF